MSVLPKWKKEQKEKRFKKQTKTLIVFIATVALVAILALGFGIYSGFKNSKAGDLDRVNFVIVSKENLLLVSLSEENSSFFLNLPAEKKIRLTRGFGEYSLVSIYPLGELESKGRKLLAESLQEYFAIPIKGVIVGSKIPENLGQLIALFWLGARGKVKSDFSKADFLILWWRARKISEFEFKNRNLSDFDCFNDLGEFNQNKLDLIMGKLFQDEKIIKENLTISFYNTTDSPGLANQATRLITNQGGRVVTVGNSQPKEQSVVRGSKIIFDSFTFKRLLQMFDALAEEREVETGRADIEIFLGTSYWKKLSEKW